MNSDDIVNTLSKFYPMVDNDMGDISCFFCGEINVHEEGCIWKNSQRIMKEQFMVTMTGRRVDCPTPSEQYQNPLPLETRFGDYWYQETTGHWMAYLPAHNDHGGFILADFSNHIVVEHEDKTITVSPSILYKTGPNGKEWHGYLERGKWREV